MDSSKWRLNKMWKKFQKKTEKQKTNQQTEAGTELSGQEDMKHMEQMIENLKMQSDHIIVPQSLQPDVFTESLAMRKKRTKREKWKTGGGKAFLKKIWKLKWIWAGAAGIAAAVFIVYISYETILMNTIKEHVVEEGGVIASNFYSGDEVYHYLKKTIQKYEDKESLWDSLFGHSYKNVEKGAAMEEDMDMVAGELPEEQGETDNYIDTNIQTRGVDEADIVKTDGTYIYMIEENQISVFDTKAFREDRGKDNIVPLTASVKVQVEDKKCDGFDVEEMYIQNEKMVLLLTGGPAYEQPEDIEGHVTIYDEDGINHDVTYVLTYDISDGKHIKKTGEVKQQGSYHASRLVDEVVYVISKYSLYDGDSLGRKNCIPLINGEEAQAGKIYIDAKTSQVNYCIISSVSMEKPDEILDYRAICSNHFEEYVSNTSIYLYGEKYRDYDDWWGSTGTYIFKFSFEEGNMDYVGYGEVEGRIHNSFSLDEYKGNLRIVTTDYSNGVSNLVYVLDKNMKRIGLIWDIAKGETIKSARFMGNVGFFVTYKNTDPVFSVDFSQPSHPQILGELKVTGFSSYLHFWQNDRLLGIGEETNPVTGENIGLKMSMFDVTDKSDVKEENKCVIQDVQSPAAENHHSVLISSEKNVIGFMDYYAKYDYWEREYTGEGEYRIYTYDSTGFQLLHNQKLEEGWYAEAESIRGIYIDGEIYLACPGNGVRYIYSCRQ